MWVQYLELSTDSSYRTIPSLLKCQLVEKWNQQQVAWLVIGRCHLMLFPLLTKNKYHKHLTENQNFVINFTEPEDKEVKGEKFSNLAQKCD